MSFIGNFGIWVPAAFCGSGPVVVRQPLGVRTSVGQFRPLASHNYGQPTNNTLHTSQPRLGLSMGHGQDSYAAPFPSSSRRHRKSALHVAAVEESELTLTRDRPGVDELQEAQTPLLQDAAVEADDEMGSTSESAATSSADLDVNFNSNGLQQTPRKKEQKLFKGEDDYKKSKQRIMQIMPAKEERGPIPESDIWFKPGDTVVGRVIWVNCFGAKVELLQDTRIVGYVPHKARTFSISESVGGRTKSDPDELCFPEGLVREFEVLQVPSEMLFFDKGPLLSAKAHDVKLIVRRLQQIQEVCQSELEAIKVRVNAVNTGGAVTCVQGVSGFIPFGRLANKMSYIPMEEAQQQLVGTDLQVMVEEVQCEFKNQGHTPMIKLILNEQKATDVQKLRELKVGAVVDGVVRRVEEYGTFVGLSGTKVSGLLHVSNISRARVDSVQQVFKVGDAIRALIIGMDSNYCRISLSTAELEVNDGDMLVDPQLVYAKADESAKLFNDILQELIASEADSHARKDARDDTLDFDNVNGS